MTKKVDVIAVNVFPAAGLEKWRKYLTRFGGGDLIIAQDSRQEVVRAFRVRVAGTTIVIDIEGEEIFRDEVASSYAVLKNAVEFGF
ncbi:MAG: hypothetical protein IIC64_14625 [SAR324 cluster bacterium]|nr:hypothetical protein [SAR324 cluster bacterium]